MKATVVWDQAAQLSLQSNVNNRGSPPIRVTPLDVRRDAPSGRLRLETEKGDSVLPPAKDSSASQPDWKKLQSHLGRVNR